MYHADVTMGLISDFESVVVADQRAWRHTFVDGQWTAKNS